MEKNFEHLYKIIIDNPLIKTDKYNFDEIRTILDKLEKILTELNLSNTVIKKSLRIVFDLFSNFRHAKHGEIVNFQLNIKNNKVFVLCENFIYADEMQPLKEKLDILNNLSTVKELKSYLRSILCNGRLGVGGVGTGLIDIRRKSENVFIYQFSNISSNVVMFSLIVSINAD